ncbi:inositol hexakisphosphate and diphosphoinositol-pentakisphosphate kinase [[Candida] railenensis]|uniref:Inositol hexakisphosphate and diphosphoinositol-pentakisphosphate kinase n=1 Tax=[Candida] railenensis TaxID=45579 RepID=A0A9P0QLJ3_9ASCO|nr:inositol hexakisphosphate and diphosphoinositol-pentakisphosphate kinase [[Candida] railenensis]
MSDNHSESEPIPVVINGASPSVIDSSDFVSARLSEDINHSLSISDLPASVQRKLDQPMSPLSLSENSTPTKSVLNPINFSASHQPLPSPATEKAIESITPMLEGFAPKTSAEESESGVASISSSATSSHALTPQALQEHEFRSHLPKSRTSSHGAHTVLDGFSTSSILKKTISNSSTGSRKSVSIHRDDSPKLPIIGKIGVCAMDAKVMSKPCRRILSRLIENGEFQTVIFGDKVILDEAIENWPTCDFLVSFFSTGFPLEKAIKYVNLRKPYMINDLVLQKALWDRRLVLSVLNFADVPTPERLEISRDGGPHLDDELKEKLKEGGVTEDQLYALTNQTEPHWEMIDDDTLLVGDKILKKPFVEKPVDGEDHNVYIYYPKSTGGGGRRLFRKIGNKSSEFDPELSTPRTEGSYVYEKFMDTDNFEDVKAYTVGPTFCHAETRKSPVVDGIVRRNTHGKEIRFITELSEEETIMAQKVSKIFQQAICGFDLLRVNGDSYVIDVNGFSFVKDNNKYYDSCASILRNLFIEAKKSRDLLKTKIPKSSQLHKDRFEEKEQKWVLKGIVSVIRHADRTPKQKFKYSFKSPLFISLLKGHKEEVIIRAVPDLQVVLETVKVAEDRKLEDLKKLAQLRRALEKKMTFPGTKIQLKPALNKENPEIVDKVQLILKWGGEPTHSAKFQATDVGEQMRQNIKLLNREALNDVKVFTSSERRVIASAQLSTTALLGLDEEEELPDDFLIIRKDLLDDSNAAKDLMDKVKKKLKPLLRQGAEAPPQFTWPPKMPQPFVVIKRVCELMNYHQQIMEYNFEKKDVSSYQKYWCCGEDPILFKERWDKLFQEFQSVEKTHPSKISELYDTMKYDALHNRQFLQKIFSFDPDDEILLERLSKTCGSTINSSGLVSEYPINILAMNNFKIPNESRTPNQNSSSGSLASNPSSSTSSGNVSALANSVTPASAGSLGWVLKGVNSTVKYSSSNNDSNTHRKRTTSDDETENSQEENSEPENCDHNNPFDHPTFARLRELYRLSKVLFDFICPQEYGIKDEEKLDIGLLTSLPLAKQILSDIQEMREHDDAGMVNYFTKESHIYTLLNVIYESQIPMKIARNSLPELDYLSQIVFELYESDDSSAPSGKKHSIRLSLSPGCHTQDPLDVQLDNDHYIGCIPKISLTRHLDIDLVIQRLKTRFSRVSLPKKFTPVNISSPLTSGI